MAELSRFLTPAEAASEIGVFVDKITDWIRAKELRAIDVSRNPKEGRPRYRISRVDWEAFLERRQVGSPPAIPLPKPRKRRPDFIEFV